MNPKCPECGLVYPESFTFCKKDGTLLSRRKRRWPYFMVAAASVIVLAAVASALALPSYLTSRLVITVAGAGFQLRGSDAYPEVALRVTNSSLIPFGLQSVSSHCLVSGSEVATAEWKPDNNQPLSVPSNGSANLRIKLNVKIFGIGDLFGMATGNAELDCRGPAEIIVSGIRVSRQVDFRCHVR